MDRKHPTSDGPHAAGEPATQGATQDVTQASTQGAAAERPQMDEPSSFTTDTTSSSTTNTDTTAAASSTAAEAMVRSDGAGALRGGAGQAWWKRAWVWLWLVFLLALGVRLVYLWQVHHTPLAGLLIGDARAYDAWGREIAAGDWLGGRTFYQAPLYPYFLGVIYWLFGHELWVVRLVQMVLGSVGCVFLALTARTLAMRPAAGAGSAGGVGDGVFAGVLAGVMLGLYPAAIFFDGLVQKSALDLPLLCVMLWLLVWGVGRGVSLEAGRWRVWRRVLPFVVAGAALGLLVLSRENALALLPVVLAWAMWGRRQESRARMTAAAAREAREQQAAAKLQTAIRSGVVVKPRGRTRQGALQAAAVVAGLCVVLSPVLVRNWVVGGEVHLTTSQFGPNFYIGNHAGADGTYQPLRYGRGDAAYERRDATELAEQALGRALSPGEVSSYWAGKAFADIKAAPGAYVKLLGRKAMMTFNHVEVTDTEGQDAWADHAPLLAWLRWWNMGLLLPVAVLGLATGWRLWRGQWLVPACLVVYGLSVVAFFVFARYRLPLVPLLMLPAAVGVAGLGAWWKQARQDRRWGEAVLAAAVTAAAGAVAYWPAVNADAQRGVSYASFAAALMDKALADARQPGADTARVQLKLKQAGAYYTRALAYTPDYAGAHYNYGVALLRMGDHERAAEHLKRATELAPAQAADAWNQLGLAMAAAGKPGDAVTCYQRALALRPGFAQAHNNLGVMLEQLGDATQAAGHYAKAIELDPQMGQAHNNLGVLHAKAGRLREAAACFEKALQINPHDADARANLQRATRMMREPAR